MNKRGIVLSSGVLLVLASAVVPVRAAQVVLDKPVKAGELTLFPGVDTPDVYYYVSDKPRLATDENGQPQFSFLRYVQPVRPGTGQPAAREAGGGGILHALVLLGVSPDQLREAQRELQRVRPGARIEGPVIFTSGKFGIVSAFKDADGRLTSKVAGIGNAPILDGEKAAISLHLTKEGVDILWESFNTPTPDVSFSFEMELSGYSSPKRAVISADFDEIYQHQAFGVGVATTMLAAEIKGAFDDLYKKGAIKVKQVGEDEKMEALLTTAYNKIAEMMFRPVGGTGTPGLSDLAGAGGSGQSLLDRASSMLTKRREEARQENDRLQRERREADQAASAERDKQRAAASASATPATPAATGGTTKNAPRSYAKTKSAPSREPDAEEVAAGGKRQQGRSQEVSQPSIAIVAAYEMKRVRQRGIYEIDLNKYTHETLTLRFDENIGDLRRYMNDDAHFRTVSLDDPAFLQREIVALVDGYNAADFGQFINFATVQLQKKHDGGDTTVDEVRVDRNNFNKEGNYFALLYGWKKDKDRSKWLAYQYRVKWSFFGGYEVEEPWRDTTEGAVTLAPPYLPRTVTLEADKGELADVRAVTVKLYYTLGNQERVERKTLNIQKDQLSEEVTYLAPKDVDDQYEYEMVFQLKGNKVVTGKRQKGVSATLFIDAVPES